MAVILRLARFGQKKRPFYRIVATDKASRRDGRFIEIVGTYNSLVNPPAVRINEEKIRKWLERGAKASGVVRTIITKNIPGVMETREKHQRSKIQAARKARKARNAGGKSTAKKASKAKK